MTNRFAPFLRPSTLGCCLGLLLCFPLASQGASISLPPAADTTLHELFAANNLGAHTHVAIGTLVTTKPDGGRYRTRGLYRFDLSQIPAGVEVTAARLRMPVIFSPGDMPLATYGLHRLNTAWGEGNKSGNTGSQASPGQANWVEARLGDTPWANPGGDFIEEPSSVVAISASGPYVFPSTPETLADVRFWLANPASNHGWLVKDEAETASQTAKRFGSREAGVNRPTLELEFTTPPAPLAIRSIQRVDGGLLIQAEGGLPNYLLEFTPALGSTQWEAVGPISAIPVFTAPLPETSGFYRVASALQTPPPSATAQYQLEFKAVWSPETHPDSYPLGAHWSSLVGGVHSHRVAFWNIGQPASPGIKSMAEFGGTSTLAAEINAAKSAGLALATLLGPSIGSGSGTATVNFTASLDHPLVTITSMIAPSPDWFIGLSGFNLIRGGIWISQIDLLLQLFDAGTDSGPSYRSPDQATNPRDPITAIAGFPALVDGSIRPFGTITLTKQ